jgi:hypothetical protein
VRYSLLMAGAVGLGILAACKVPQAPEWDIGVLLPYTSDTVAVLDLLPSAVSVDTVGMTPVFEIQSRTDSLEFPLGQMCGPCQVLHGQTVQVPSFEYLDSLDVPFPPELVAIQVISAPLEIRVTNGLNFDVLRPDPDPADAGYIALVARDIAAGTTIDSVFISGASETMIPGETKTLQFEIADMEISKGVRIVVHLLSPQDNQTVTIDANRGTKVVGLLGPIQVSGASVVVDDRPLDEQVRITVDPTVRDAVADQNQGGQFELELQHSLDLEGVLRASIAGSPADLFSGDPTRDIVLDGMVLTPGLTQTREVTAAELRQIATFEEVYVGYRAVASGTGTGPGGELKVARFTPEQSLHVNLQLRSVRRVDF